MKKLFLTLLVLLPVVVTAAPVSFVSTWDSYTPSTATMHMKCGVNAGAKAEVGTAAASTGQIAFTIDANPGDDVKCIASTNLGTDVSPDSAEVTVHIPLALSPPVIHIRVAP